MAVLRYFALAAILCLPVVAQRRTALPQRYDRWLNQEVLYIITDEEKKEFLKLATDEQRDKYIDDFWDVRNPLRGSRENPFKEGHYKRIEYANANFGRYSNTPGWMTDMGRTWILFGKPASQAKFTGYGQFYPCELWFYSNDTSSPSLPAFYYVLFYMPEDVGEYKFYRPFIDGPMKLVRGSQFNSNADVYKFLRPLGGDLAHAAFSLNPSEPIDTVDFNPSMSGDMQVAKIQNFANDKFNVERLREQRYLRAKVQSWFLVQQEKSLDIPTLVLSDPAGQYWLDYAIFVDSEKLGRRDSAAKQLVVNFGYRLTNEKGDLIIEDAEERAYPAYDDNGRFKPFLLANRIPVVPGKYKLEVTMVNREAGRSYHGERAIEVGGSQRVTIGGPLMASSVEQVRAPDSITPFQYFGVQFLPAADRKFMAREPLRLLFQMHAQPAAYKVEYVLGHAVNRAIRQTFSDSVGAQEFHNGSLLKSKTLQLAGLDTGEYRVAVNVRAEGSEEVLASAALSFKIADDQTQPTLFFASNLRGAASPGVAAYIRALESLSQKEETKAADYLRASLDQMPKNPLAAQALVQLYFGSRRFDRITELYQRLGATAFNGSPETLAQAALSFWQTGNTDGARRVLEAGETFFPKHPLLAAAAKQISRPIRR